MTRTKDVMTVMTKMRRFQRMPPSERWAVLRVIGAGIAVAIGLRLLPLPRLLRLLGVSLADSGRLTSSTGVLTPDEVRLVEISERIFRYGPARGRCLRRSLVLGWLLRRSRPCLCLGVKRDRGVLLAHAWLEAPGLAEDDGAFRRLRRSPGWQNT